MEPMAQPDSSALIDTLLSGSVSFAPPDPSDLAAFGTAQSSASIGAGRLVSTPALLGGASRDGVSGYPIQVGKVQRPPLRDETLARHRLLDWLDVKIHNRVVFVIADAGYGKTTLLADFSRRTRLRTLWYRMDEEDRNWVTFLSYLVAAGREHEPGFAPRTHAMLQDTGPGGATRDDVLASFIREMPTVAGIGTVLILDDYHSIDDGPDVRMIVRRLIESMPERFTVIVSSRREPSIPVARLRSLGEIAELRSSDLRFSATETEALFNGTYGRDLDHDTLATLSDKTEGWAASLSLVHVALRDRSTSETRSFIKHLSGAHGELHDYLAEEVIRDLSPRHQGFLMRTSILLGIDHSSAGVATGLDVTTVSAFISDAERLGLLTRRDSLSRRSLTFHPLVRDFLTARLTREIGGTGLCELHSRIARWAEDRDWRTAAYHFGAAGQSSQVHAVLRRHIESIVGSGEVVRAAEFLAEFPPLESAAEFEIIRSRRAGLAFEFGSALAHARRAIELDPGSDPAKANLLATYFLVGDLTKASELAANLARAGDTALAKNVGQATYDVIQASMSGLFSDASTSIESVRVESQTAGLTHYVGVALLDMALLERARGNTAKTTECATGAMDALERSSSGSELIAAMLALAWARAHAGQMTEARSWMAAAAERAVGQSRKEWLTESADIETLYGDESTAATMVAELRHAQLNPALELMSRVTDAEFALRQSELDEARRLLDGAPSIPVLESGFLARWTAVWAHLQVRLGSPEAMDAVTSAINFAENQGSEMWARYARALMVALVESPSAAIQSTHRVDPAYLSMVAELVLASGAGLDDEAAKLIVEEASNRPDRWRPSVRRIVGDASSPNRLFAARLLDVIGEARDVQVLRAMARTGRGTKADPSLGRGLARRLAKPVLVEDLGRVEIQLGNVHIAGSDLRRKVLGLLTFLLTRPRYSATRDEVIDAIWPDLDPEVAINSLNQTVYFLRRVFEPGYKDDLSAGYVRHDSDVIWLDDGLVSSRSRDVRLLIDAASTSPTPERLAKLSRMYVGRFALDFSYEEWAVPFREALHVGYLQVIEGGVARDIATGHYEHGIELARRALIVEPDSESLHVSLLRLLRDTGAHSAAAEQYEHYATYMRDELGIDPPPLSAL
jgi:ATP/maltotriose-dependent transcriptional regulator MalT/DNA-binding SARP family transcriptional activator